MKAAKWALNFLVSALLIVATLAGFFFQDLVSVDVEI